MKPSQMNASIFLDSWESRPKIPFVEYLIESRHIELLYLGGSRPVYEMLPDLKKTFPNLKGDRRVYIIQSGMLTVTESLASTLI